MSIDGTEIDLEIIEAVRKHECLYNLKSPKYKHCKYKELLWNTIGKQLGKTGNEIKTKWKTFRDCYRKYQHGTCKQYQYADYMRFLDNFDSCRLKTYIPLSDDAEVSTDLSSDYEYQHSPPTKQLKPNKENLHDNEMQDFYEDSWNAADSDNAKTGTANQDSGATRDCIEHLINEENLTTSLKNIDNEDFMKNLQKTDLNERLIYEVKKYDCIYNLESPQYKDFEYKKHLWHKIGKRTGLRADDARVKWKNMKDAYRKYKLRSLNENGFRKPYKYSNSLKFLDNINSYRPFNIKKNNNFSEQEVSTDLSTDEDILHIPTTTNRIHNKFEKLQKSNIYETETNTVNANNITIDLFKLLVNKIDEANLNAKDRNDIEFAVSTAVYSKLAEYNKTKS